MKKQQAGIRISIGETTLTGVLHYDLAPASCKLFLSLIAKDLRVVHCRWSGESMWVPFKQPKVALPFENHTSQPVPGQVLIYAAGFSEPEILIPYGGCMFNSKVGILAGNHFMTLTSGQENLSALGRTALWEGAQTMKFHKQ